VRLYVIRHGKAERDSDTGRDADRVLRPRGHRQAAYLASVLAEADVPPARVLSSPYPRAHQTATPIAEALDLEVDLTDLLASASVSAILDLVAEAHDRGDPSLALVGHNPTLSTLTSLLVEGVGMGGIELRTGQAAQLELDSSPSPGGARLLRTIRLEDDD